MEENNKIPIQLIRKADYHLHPMKLIEPPNVQPVIGVGIIDDKIVAILPDNIYSLRECYLDETNRPHISTNLVRGIMIIDGDISIQYYKELCYYQIYRKILKIHLMKICLIHKKKYLEILKIYLETKIDV